MLPRRETEKAQRECYMMGFRLSNLKMFGKFVEQTQRRNIPGKAVDVNRGLILFLSQILFRLDPLMLKMSVSLTIN